MRHARASVLLAMLFTLAPLHARAQAADVPYVPTPMNVVEAMLALATVGPQDFVIDLGSGDGRIVIAAAKTRGARGLGVELDGALVSTARRAAERQGVADKVEFRTENLFITDLDRASVLTTYLFTSVNMQLRPRIFAQMKPGSRIVSHEFDFGSWKPDARVTVDVPNKPYGAPRSDVLMWVVPANAAGTWRWSVPADGRELVCEATFRQRFQELQGFARAGAGAARIEQARLRGADISFTLAAELYGKPVRHEFVGRIAGDTIRGTMRSSGKELEWHAARVSPGRIDIEAAAGARALAAQH